MFNDNPDSKWFREFSELGAAKVRGALVANGWDQAKQVAARRWLEKQDVQSWQAKRGSVTPDAVSWRERLRKSKWWVYVAAAMFLLFGLLRYMGIS